MANIKYSRASLQQAIDASVSWAEVCRWFGKSEVGGCRSYLKKRAEGWGLDYSHFLGQQWVLKYGTPNTKPLDYFLCLIPEDRTIPKGVRLKKALIDFGIEHCCGECGQPPEWCGKPLVLQVDHIDGNRRDCRVENLRLLCPNCHTQTSTWGTKNIGA